MVRHVRSGLLVITADTSYSNMSAGSSLCSSQAACKASKLFNQANNRGEVVTSVRLRGDIVHLEVRVRKSFSTLLRGLLGRKSSCLASSSSSYNMEIARNITKLHLLLLLSRLCSYPSYDTPRDMPGRPP